METNTAAATARTLHGILQVAYPDASIGHGWRLSDPGPARYGWWAQYPAGRCEYLGRTLADAQARLVARAEDRAKAQAASF